MNKELANIIQTINDYYHSYTIIVNFLKKNINEIDAEALRGAKVQLLNLHISCTSTHQALEKFQFPITTPSSYGTFTFFKANIEEITALQLQKEDLTSLLGRITNSLDAVTEARNKIMLPMSYQSRGI